MIIVKATTYIGGLVHRCTSKARGSKTSLKKESKMASLNIEFVKILGGMYC